MRAAEEIVAKMRNQGLAALPFGDLPMISARKDVPQNAANT
jgi:hypothetical protein